MGASAIEQIYLPNLLSASGIKPTKFQKSEGDWVFKLARSTYAQAGEISPRTTTSRHRRAAPGAFRGHRRFPPRTLRVSPRTWGQLYPPIRHNSSPLHT